MHTQLNYKCDHVVAVVVVYVAIYFVAAVVELSTKFFLGFAFDFFAQSY